MNLDSYSISVQEIRPDRMGARFVVDGRELFLIASDPVILRYASFLELPKSQFTADR